MSPRKRREPPSPISPRRSPKRLRAPPTPWNHPEEAFSTTTPGSGPASKYNSSGPYYEIKAILDESDTKYLVDWADDLISKQSYVPDWQPKKFLNAAAVKLWEAVKATGTRARTQKESQSPPKTPVRPRNPRVLPPPSTRPQLRSSSAAQVYEGRDASEPQKRSAPAPQSQRSIQTVSPSVDISIFPDVAVQISQQSDLEKDSYLTYHSTSSAAQLPSSSATISNGNSRSTASWQPETPTINPSSTPDPSLIPAGSTTREWTPNPDQVSTYDPSVSSNPSPTRASASENGATIPDSQSLPRSPNHVAVSPKSTPQLPESATTAIQNSAKTQHNSDSENIQPLVGTKSNTRISARGVKSWVVDDSSTQSQQSSRDSRPSRSKEPLGDRSSQSVPSSSIQIPASAESLSRKGEETVSGTQDHITIPRTQVPSTQEVIISIEDESVTQATNSPVQTNLPLAMDSRAPLDSTDAPIQKPAEPSPENASGVPESMAERLDRQFREVSARTNALLTAEREERLRSRTATPAIPSPIKRTNLEIATRGVNMPRSPKAPSSPSLVRAALSPKVPLSPSALRSPLEVRGSNQNIPQSPRNMRSPSHIPERLPYQPQGGQSYLPVEPSEVAKNVQASAQRSRTPPHALVADGPSSSQTTTSLPTTTLDVRSLGPMEYLLPLSMPPRTQKQYIETYRFYLRRIQSFLQNGRPDDALRDDLNVLLDRVGKVTTHMDLDGGGPSSQEQVDADQEASYAESCSEKFRFLGHLLEATQQDILHIVIFAREGQLLDYIETFLRSKKVNYTRPDSLAKSDPDASVGQSHISLLASRDDGSYSSSWKADLVIAFDETFDANDLRVKGFRVQETSALEMSPVIRLVVYGSLEHINLCISTALEPIERMRRLIYCMLICEKVVGQLGTENLQSSLYSPSIYASQVVEFLHKGSNQSDWEVPSMPTLEISPAMDLDSATSEAMSETSDEFRLDSAAWFWPNPKPRKTKVNDVKAGEKRSYDLVYGDSLEIQAKKFKLGREAAQRQERGDTSTRPLEPVHPPKDPVELNKILETDLHKAKTLLKEFDAVFEVRQAQFESDRNLISSLKSSNETLQTQLHRKTTELEYSNAALVTAKEARSILESDLDRLRQEIRTNPSYKLTHMPMVHAEDMRHRLAEAKSEIALKDRKIQGLETDFNFTRNQYQNASSAFAEAQSTIAAQESELIILRRRADEVRVQLREIRDRDVNASLRKEVSRLRETVKMREKEVRERETEVRDLRRGRAGVVTRGSSVQPGIGGSGVRSPRGGSRGVSPAVVGGHGAAGLVGGNGGSGGPGMPGGAGGVPMARAPSGLSSRFG